MTSAGTGPATRWVDRCLLIGDVPALPYLAEGWVAVLIAPGETAEAAQLAAALQAGPRAEVLLLDAGPLGPALASELGRPVLAPDGPVVLTPGGVLVTAGAFLRHRPGRTASHAGPRWPAPSWQQLVPAATRWPAGVSVRPTPSGWLLAPAELHDGGSPAFDGVEFAVAVDPDRPRLLLDPALTGAQLAAAMRALPTRVRRVADLVPLAPGQGAGRALATDTARRLGEPVHLLNGVPLHRPGGPITVFSLDAHRRPVWAEPAWLLRFTADGGEEVVASSPPQPALRTLNPSTYVTEAGWQVRLSGGGVHALPGPGAPDDAGRAAGVYRVVVGVPGAPIDDLVWPVLSAMLTAFLGGVPARVELVAAGEPSEWGAAAARELAERHPGGGLTGGQPKEFQRAELVAMPDTAVPHDAPAGAAAAGRRRALLAVAAAVLVGGAAAGAVAWHSPGSSDATGLAVGAEPRLAGSPPQSPAGADPSAAAGVSSRPSRSPSARPSSPPPSVSPSVPAAPSSSTSLGLAGNIDLAAGRPTAESSHTDVYTSGRVTDGDPMTYWESRNNALPQWVQVDLGAPADVRRVVLRLPPSADWPARTQTVTVLGSLDGSSYTTVAGGSCRFDAAGAQRATLSVSGGQQRYLRVLFSANSVQQAGQLSALEVYRS